MNYASLLRQELSARNLAFAHDHRLPHAQTYSGSSIVIYEGSENGDGHGNFYGPSFRAIAKNAAWRQRLSKTHTTAHLCLPSNESRRRELDSSNSSDALLMNIFCCPGISANAELAARLGYGPGLKPEFGVRARIPRHGRIDRTELDLRIGNWIAEAKLIEADFQSAPADRVESYDSFSEVFDSELLPTTGESYKSYQLIRNILAAHHSRSNFCVLLDARRPDLFDAYCEVTGAIRLVELKTRCRVCTWQETARSLPKGLQVFLRDKFGIVAE